MWKCKRCGKCCKFIVVPVRERIDIETQAYLDAHGIAVQPSPQPSPDGGGRQGGGGAKLLIPAVCEHLDVENGSPIIYRCKIHNIKFANCRLAGKKECSEAKRAYALLYPSSQPSPNGGGSKDGNT